jgi:hypothetical protein
MIEPSEFELRELATPYALDAVSENERAAIEARVAAASTAVATAFDDEVRLVRETMAAVSASTPVEPPRLYEGGCWRPSSRARHADSVGAPLSSRQQPRLPSGSAR